MEQYVTLGSPVCLEAQNGFSPSKQAVIGKPVRGFAILVQQTMTIVQAVMGGETVCTTESGSKTLCKEDERSTLSQS